MIVMRVELPVEEMLGRSDVEGVAEDGSSTMAGSGATEQPVDRVRPLCRTGIVSDDSERPLCSSAPVRPAPEVFGWHSPNSTRYGGKTLAETATVKLP